MTKQMTVHVHSAYPVGQVDSRIFGGFLEHLGRAVYEGVYDPASPHADAQGLRTDVMRELRRMNMTVMRYPGGNFVSGYHWRDGVGPRAERPCVMEPAWKSTETNAFGTDEFMGLCAAMGWTPMMTVNLGTGTAEEARDWVEYCNGDPGTRWADLRAANGHPEPYKAPLWCLGNEMDGDWQMGHMPARDYAVKARLTAQLMKMVDPTIELVVCGTCWIILPTYMEWDYEVLDYAGDMADYISLHRYVGNPENDTQDFLAVTKSIDAQIEDMDAACRFVQAKRRRKRRTRLCFDEWNVWYKNHESNGHGAVAPHLLEEEYNLEDALVAAGFLQSFLRHADIVKVANLAQIVNVIAPIMTCKDGLLVQSIFHPFAMMAARRDGVSLRVAPEGPEYESKSHGTVSMLDASAILGDGMLHVFATNRDPEHTMELHVRPGGMSVAGVADAEILTGPGPKAVNTWDEPDVVATHPLDGVRVANGRATCELPPLSFAAISLRVTA